MRRGKGPSPRWWVACAGLVRTLAGGFFLLGARLASAQADIPPVYPSVDENGVDLASGHVSVAPTSISIGPGGRGSLSFSFANGNSAQSMVSGSIYPTPGSSTKVTVRIASQSEVFTGATTFTNDQGGGSTLTFDAATQRYTYTAADGTVGIFQRLANVQPYGEIAFIETLTYPGGERLTYNYGTTYGLRSISTNLGYQLRFALNSQGAVVGVTLFNMANEACDPAATSCTLSGTWPRFDIYSSSVTDVLGRVTQIQLNGTTQTVVTYATGRTMTYNIGTDGRVTSVSDGNGIWTYAYQLNQGVSYTTVTAPGSASVRRVFWNSTTGAVTAVTVGDGVSSGRTTAYVRDASGRLTAVATPDGGHVELTYDARGNVTEQRRVSATPGTPADIVTTASYPASCANPVTCNKPDYVIDARGNRTDFTYDSVHGGVTSVTGPAPSTGAVRPQVRYSYAQFQATWLNGSGTPVQGTPVWRLTATSQCATLATCANGADETRTTISYGANDALLPVSTTSASGDGALAATATMTYTPTGDLRTVDGPLAGSTDTVRHYYDAARQRTGTIGPDPDGGGALLHRAGRITYNIEGQVTLAERGTATGQGDSGMASFVPLQQVATVYDAQGRPVRQSLAADGTTFSVTQTSYTAAGLVDCTAQRMNPDLFASLPASACTPASPPAPAPPDGAYGPDRIARTTYDPWYQPTEVRTAIGTALEAVEVASTYTAQGVATVTDGNGNRTTYEYDGFSRLRNTRFPLPGSPGVSAPTSGAGADYQQYGYDPAGNVVSRRNRAGQTISSSYDALGRMTLLDRPNAIPWELDVTYQYDNLGRLVSAVDGYTHQFTFAYDALGRRLSETDNWPGTMISTWDVAGRRTRLAWRDGFYVDYVYNDAGEMTQIRENGATSGPGVLATFTYDNLGRRVSLIRGNGTTTTYSYDAASRLSGLAHDLADAGGDVGYGYAYNPAGQIVGTTRSNDAYAWTGHYAVNRNYSSNGLNQHSAAGSATFSYDANGNLASDGTNTYSYDVDNRLTYLHDQLYDAFGRLYAGVGIPAFLYDGQQAAMEANRVNGAILRRYVFGPGTDEPLVWYEGAGTSDRRWLHADERGSVVAVSNDGGALTAINRYDEYGLPQGPSGVGTLYGRFGYTGQMWLPQLGLYHYRARTYSPTLGRFLQTDPIGYGDGMNMYAYVGNDPVNLFDPTGLSAEWCGFVNVAPQTATYGPSGEIVVNAPPPAPYWCGNMGGDVQINDQFVIDAFSHHQFNMNGDEQFFRFHDGQLQVTNAAQKRSCPGGVSAYKPPSDFYAGDDDPGHTHPSGFEPRIGPDDGVAAQRTGTAYMVSSSGAFRINRYRDGSYSASRLAGHWGASNSVIRGIITRWNQHSGASVAGGLWNQCTVVYNHEAHP